MIELFEKNEIVTLQGDSLKIEVLKSTNELEITALITNYSITGITPAINHLDDDTINTLISKVSSKSFFSETTILDEVGTGRQVLFDLVFVDASSNIILSQWRFISSFSRELFGFIRKYSNF